MIYRRWCGQLFLNSNRMLHLISWTIWPSCYQMQSSHNTGMDPQSRFYLLIISRTPPNAFAALSWGRFSTTRNTDKDKQKPRQRQKDRCTFLSFELIGKLVACSDSIRILGSERGLSWAVLVCNSFTMTHTQIRKQTNTHREHLHAQIHSHTLTHGDKNKLINTQAHRQKQAHRSKQTHNFTHTRFVYNTWTLGQCPLDMTNSSIYQYFHR